MQTKADDDAGLGASSIALSVGSMSEPRGACGGRRLRQSRGMKIVRMGWVLALVLAAAGVGAAEKAKPAAPTKKAAEENKIGGLTIPRPTGEFLGLEISNNNFVLTFYDAKKKKNGD